MKTSTHFLSYLAQFFLEWKMFQTKVLEKTKTHILCSVTYIKKLEINKKKKKKKKLYSRTGVDENMAHVHCMLDT
jgi:hypothetical protein